MFQDWVKFRRHYQLSTPETCHLFHQDEKDRRTCPIAVLGTTGKYAYISFAVSLPHICTTLKAGVGRKALISQFLNRRFPVKHEEPAQGAVQAPN